jgi:hypothetical protein
MTPEQEALERRIEELERRLEQTAGLDRAIDRAAVRREALARRLTGQPPPSSHPGLPRRVGGPWGGAEGGHNATPAPDMNELIRDAWRRR